MQVSVQRLQRVLKNRSPRNAMVRQVLWNEVRSNLVGVVEVGLAGCLSVVRWRVALLTSAGLSMSRLSRPCCLPANLGHDEGVLIVVKRVRNEKSN